MLDLGLNKAQVAKMISGFPQVLGCSIEKNLKPTVQWMLDLGLNKAQVSKVILVFPALLGYSLEKNMKVKWELLRCFLSKDSTLELVAAFPPIFGYKLDRLRSRIECLDDEGKIRKLASAMSLSQADFDRRFCSACPETSRAYNVVLVTSMNDEGKHDLGELPVYSPLYTSSRAPGHLGVNIFPEEPFGRWTYLLDPGSMFFELIPSNSTCGMASAIPAWEAEVGGRYELLVTSYSGLCRCRTGDTLLVHAMYGKMPSGKPRNSIAPSNRDAQSEHSLPRFRCASAFAMSLDDLGLSSDSELTGDVHHQESENSEGDFREFAKSLGVDAEDGDLLWVAKEAFEAPLPSGWSEHLDPEGRVYFFSQVTQQSSWSHPMDDVFRELIQLIKSVRRLDPPEASVMEAVQSHLQSTHDRATAALEGWSGPYMAEDGEYFCNFQQGVSTWHNPVEQWQTDLAVRQQVLHRCLLQGFAKASNGISSSEAGSEKSDVLPALPLHLARPSADKEAAPPSPSSARSYATCISARSISVTPRSRRPSLCGSEAAGSRNASKSKMGAAQSRLSSRSKSGRSLDEEAFGTLTEQPETARQQMGNPPIRSYADAKLRAAQGYQVRLPHGLAAEPGNSTPADAAALLAANGIYQASPAVEKVVFQHLSSAGFKIYRDEQVLPSGKVKHGWLLSGQGEPLYGESLSVPLAASWRCYKGPEPAPRFRAFKAVAEAVYQVVDDAEVATKEALKAEETLC
eukprot:s143_g8.t3